MKCPKCRCEVGNQSICPYCGATVYINGNGWSNSEYPYRALGHKPDSRGYTHYASEGKDTEQRLKNLETRVNMSLVFQCGVFILNVLILLILAMK